MNDSESHDSLANAEQDDAKEMKAHEEKEKKWKYNLNDHVSNGNQNGTEMVNIN